MNGAGGFVTCLVVLYIVPLIAGGIYEIVVERRRRRAEGRVSP